MSKLGKKMLGVVGTLAIVVAGCGPAASSPTPAATPGGATPGAATPGASPTDTANDCGITVNNGKLEPLASGFPNRPLTIINIDDAGAPDGIYALAVKAAAESNGIIDQRINVVDRPDFGTYGTWEGLEFINNDRFGKEGYVMAVATIPGATVDLIETDVVANLGASIESLNAVGSTEFVPYVMTSRKDAPWGNSFEEMIKYAQANPGELRYISRGPGSGLDTAFKNYQQSIEGGIPVTEIIGGSHAEINSVLGAGEGDIAMTLSDVGKRFYDDGRVEVLTFSGNAPAPESFDVPTAKEVIGLESDPWGQNRTLFTGTDVPECHFQWLEKLVELVVATPSFQESRLQVPGLTLQNLSREEVVQLSNDAYEKACPIMKEAGLVHETVTECD
jgi:tripartite-type tricarboxylate transporter receptor subunit TctC